MTQSLPEPEGGGLGGVAFEIDDVSDPAGTRDLIVAALAAADGVELLPRRPWFVDTW